jgi:hypothetical protein
MSGVNLLGYAASIAVLATFCTNGMISLRLVAIVSNVLFATYALSAHIQPVLILHAILLPVNFIRLVQNIRLRS